ncbi:hypothetical protein BV22DRAFT_893721 [Leucogyrophana mollusca]|uniref:Uncharacterized protein n=1 Tax=Leucogyrophana mollusca TaxID=85980 RepID=A0ACB8AZN9_9AGAM|nr:hypothetical protein BV22DRAFT_893721 [Leucogyrophana mollusca]
MDEATLTEVKRSLQMLIGRAQNVLDGLGSVDLSTNDGFSSIDPFKIAVRNFKQALGEMWRRIQSIDSSDNAAMAFALLNVEACSKALYNLLGALRKAEDALSRRVSELVASVAASRGTGTLSRRQVSDGEESSLQLLRALDSIAGTTIVSLQDLQNTLWRHVSDFHDSCELLERFKRTFFRQPFHFTGPGRNYHLYGLQPRKSPHTIGFDKGWVDRYSIAVKALGKIWVDHRLQAHAPVLAIAKAQITLLKHLRLLIDRETPMIQQSHRARAQAESILQALKANIEKEVVRENTQRFSVAFCGMVKAGKSLFLNTLVGRSLLPSDELPSTAWPCRLQHVKGQVVPSLEIDATYFQVGIDGLRRCKYGAMMDQFNAPEDADPFSDDIEGSLDEDMDEDMSSADTEDINELNRKREIYYIWAEFHPATQEHLLVFEQDDYQIPARADGEGDVSDLASVNQGERDITRSKFQARIIMNLPFKTLSALGIRPKFHSNFTEFGKRPKYYVYFIGILASVWHEI